MVLFVHGRGHAVMQGPKKVYPAQTVAEMIAANGTAPFKFCLKQAVFAPETIPMSNPPAHVQRSCFGSGAMCA